jgi:hypothetical protein
MIQLMSVALLLLMLKAVLLFGIPHMRASVVLTTLRLGLLGSHIFALSSGNIGLLRELPIGGDGADNVGEEDDC